MMVGGTWTESKKDIEDLSYISNKMWCAIQELSIEIPVF